MSDNKIMYMTTQYRSERIKAVEVVKETPAFVTFIDTSWGEPKERRAARESDWNSFHDTWEAARDYLMKRQNAVVLAARRSLELANSELGNIKGMKPPKVHK